jgi:proteasome accessory factor B
MKKSTKAGRNPGVPAKTTPASPARQFLTRPPLVRIQKIHAALAEGKYPNAPMLAAQLEIGVKTIRRDLESMRDQLSYPIDYDKTRRGFYYTGAVSDFPLMKATEGELLALAVARQALQAYEGTPYAHVLASSLKKLTAMLGDEISFSPADFSEAVSFRSQGVGHLDAALYTAVSKAVLERREVEFDYTKPGCDTERRHAQPYHLVWMNRECYLIARDLDKQAMRQFKLVRMANLKAARRRFTRDSGFSPENYFSDSFGIIRGEGTRRVRIRFNDYAAQLVRERFWHDSQTLRDLRGGGLEMELRVSDLDEIKRWVLKFCGDAQAIEPPELVAAVRADAKRIARAHG